jgi:lambda family phage portal protein
MNRFERAMMQIAPRWVARRAQARLSALAYSRAYEAAEPGRHRRRTRNEGSGNRAIARSMPALRDYARQLERNHDLARGVLSVLVRNVVGPNGIGVEPQPRKANGSDIDDALAHDLRGYWSEWCQSPEVTREHDFAGSQQLLARSWFRDGDVFFQMLKGHVPGLQHATNVPLSIELIESDLIPFDFNDSTRGIINGVERDTWCRAIAYHVYKSHPGDPFEFTVPGIVRKSADSIGHVRLIDRIGQARGVSIFASVLTRLEDLKDYEESERVAAKIAACLAAVIIKGDPGSFQNGNDLLDGRDGAPEKERRMQLKSGMIFDGLRQGEDVRTIDTRRPNAQLEPHRNGQLRAIAAGSETSYSSASKNYDGTYSAQRQELVEQWAAYALLSNAFITQCVRPIYQQFVSSAVLSNRIKLPAGVSFSEAADAIYVAPRMPWIDPLKEVTANEIAEQRCYRSAPEIIRSTGGNPDDVLRQQAAWLRRREELLIPNPDASGLRPVVTDAAAGNA